MRESSRPWHFRLVVGLASAVLGSCSGGGPATPTAVVPQQGLPQVARAVAKRPNALPSYIDTYYGDVNGTQYRFRPKVGDSPSGGHGQVVDRITCDPTMTTDKYHVHIWLGVVYDGQLMALPRGLGMEKPGPVTNGHIDTAECFYGIHTHDSSGIVHTEFNRNLPNSAVLVPLRKLFDIWGIARAAEQFGPFRGRMHVYVAEPSQLGQTLVGTFGTYHHYRGNIDDIKIQSHEVVWIEIGKPYYDANQLPPVKFYLEY